MNRKVTILILLFYCAYCERYKTTLLKTTDPIRHRGSTHNKTPLRTKVTSTTTELPSEPVENLTNQSGVHKPIEVMKVPDNIDIPIKKKSNAIMIKPRQVQEWAKEISDILINVEKQVVRRELLLKNYAEAKKETRNGTAIVEKMAAALEELLEKRAEAAEAIGRQAEKLASSKVPVQLPPDYIFDNSIKLGEPKKFPEKPESEWEIANNCSSLRRIPLKNMTHFGKSAEIELDITSVKIANEVFDCDPRILKHVYWSEGLLHTFRQNYAQDALTDFQYFCSAKGFLRHYPAASWESMFKLKLDDSEAADVYDCRLRPWYVSAGGAPRDIVILLDASGSMVNSTNKVNAEWFTLALLSALTDDDQINVIRFNSIAIESAISCFNDKLVPANYVNSAALMGALRLDDVRNETKIPQALRYAVKMLQRQHVRSDKPRSCQQAIIMISDSINENYTEIMRDLDPGGTIRLFVIWLHDPWGLRDNSHLYGEWLSCSSDGYFTELMTHADVTEQVMNILRVLDRPLVHQRKERLRVFSDVYAHVEDPRRSDFYWKTKENAEQKFRYQELRRDKNWTLSDAQRYKTYMHQQSLNLYGHYYEGIDLDYRLQISVSVPVFEDTTSENITIVLAEEKQRNSTRTYPVNRLLGVAGVDIPVEHIKLILPYYQIGAGGSLFIVDHRGNIVLHDNLKPVFDGDILKPGYRTVDMLDLEQSAIDLPLRNYSADWLQFRNDLVIEKTKGSKVMYAKNIFENGLRAILERREYHWKRVQNHYTVVVVLPENNRQHAVLGGPFTQQLAEKAYDSIMSELAVHPNWLYCKHVDQHFDEPEFEVRHFVKRRKEEPDFKMQNLFHRFSPLRPTLLEKTYLCNEELIARLCHDAMATQQWADDPHPDRDRTVCELGSVVAFFASESGLTRWQLSRVASAHKDAPEGSEWPWGPSEVWYKRAAASPGTLVIHAPVTPIRKMRMTQAKPPAIFAGFVTVKASKLGETILNSFVAQQLQNRHKWMTAARTLGHSDKGMIGVAGYHFYPEHLEDVFKLTTNSSSHCEDGEECEARCDGKDWACVIIDEGGWIVAGYWPDQDSITEEDPAREHLARLYPHAMGALLDADVFKLHWIHDYQGVCFPPEDATKSATRMIPSLLKSLWHSVYILFHVTKQLVTILALISSGGLVVAQTEAEKQKGRRVLLKNYEREKYERLYDDRVLVNRTPFTTCDRSRALYELQRTPRAFEMLLRRPRNCTWPVVGAAVPHTNLVLLAIFKPCPYTGRPVPDPLRNDPVDTNDPQWGDLSPASRLACLRNRAPLPERAPHSTCFPHEYAHEEGYRQCGPWLPDPEIPEPESLVGFSPIQTFANIILLLVVCLHVIRNVM